MKGGATLALGAGFLLLLWAERRRPLRRPVQPDAARVPGNLLAGAAAALTVAVTQTPLVQPLALRVEKHRLGLVPRLGLSPAGATLLALVLLDYTLYLWHVLLHRALWRWHRFHHADRDLDTSTALRFHAMELLWSLPWRAAQVLLIGVTPRQLKLWSQLTGAEVMFHHSNLRLAPPLERALGWLVVTPALHGVHHADRERLQHANLSSGLTVWDRLHGTYLRVEQPDRVTIGLPREEAAHALARQP
ncbi:sterol desaturase family protein [Ramlibacter sp. AN1015]|uniref:sterol desaturase family protein n=1 Tax=Ramlibacter sp. AN1015 TaxID=3133428 RepID=UPI0030C47D2F